MADHLTIGSPAIVLLVWFRLCRLRLTRMDHRHPPCAEDFHTMHRIRLLPAAGATLAALALLAACGGGGGDSPAADGTLRLSLTDAPSCGYDNAHVTVQKVRVHKSSSAGDADAGWS